MAFYPVSARDPKITYNAYSYVHDGIPDTYSAAKSTERFLKEAAKNVIVQQLTYLNQVKTLIQCAIQPGLQDADRGAIRKAARSAISELPRLTQLDEWKGSPEFTLHSLMSLLADHGEGIVTEQTIGLMESLLVAHEQDPTRRYIMRRIHSKWTEVLADLKSNFSRWNTN